MLLSIFDKRKLERAGHVAVYHILLFMMEMIGITKTDGLSNEKIELTWLSLAHVKIR